MDWGINVITQNNVKVSKRVSRVETKFYQKKKITNETKMTVFRRSHTNVWLRCRTVYGSIQIFGSETWILYVARSSRIHAIVMRYLRAVKGVIRMDRRTRPNRKITS